MRIDQFRERQESFQLIDVRNQEEWDAGHAPDAIHLPLAKLAEGFGSIELEGRPVLVCRTGQRSRKGVELIKSQVGDVASLEGGMSAWVEAGLPIVDEHGQPGQVLGPDPAPDDLTPELAETRDNFLEVIFGLQQRYGNREPTEDEVREFMREWLTKKGTSPEEIERILTDDQ